MATRRNATTQQERSFWRDAYLAADVALLTRTDMSPDEAASRAAEYADASVEQMRARTGLWSGRE